MANRQRWTIIIGVALIAIFLSGAPDASAMISTDRDCGVTAGGGYRKYFIDGDDGRFRQDRFGPDDRAGTVENNLALAGHSGDIRYDLDFQAAYSSNYNLRYNVSREDAYSIKFRGDQYRKYYDGSNLFWADPLAYQVPTSIVEIDDNDLAADRGKMHLEYGLTLPYHTELTLGYDRWSRKGTEVLLHSGSLVQGTGLNNGDTQPTVYMIPTVNQVDGVSNSFSAGIEHTFAGKYNFYLEQEWETYHDAQYYDLLAYTNGTLSTNTRYITNPKFKEGLTSAGVNSHLTDKVYFSINYLHSYLNNQSTLGTTSFDTPVIVGGEGQNYRTGDAVNIGFAVHPLPALQAQASYRFEHAHTSATGVVAAYSTGLQTFNESNQDERQHAENLTLTFHGIPRTLVSLEGNWEQAKEIVSRTYWSTSKWGYDNDNLVRDAEYSALIVNRPFAPLKFTFRYQYKNGRNDWRETNNGQQLAAEGIVADTTYPGVLKDGDNREHDWVAKLDWRVTPLWNVGVEYQLQRSRRHYEAQGDADGRRQETDRISLNILGNPFPKFTVMGSAIREQYEFRTPVEGIDGSTWEYGTEGFNYSADVWLYTLGGSYALTSGSSANLKLQHTYVSGDVRNTQNELWAGYQHNLTDSQKLELRYEFFDYNDKSSNGKDDYDGHGVYVGYSISF